MDGASEDPVWRTRRAVLAALLVVGIVTGGYAVVATASDGGDMAPSATDAARDDVVTAVRPSDGQAGPLRLGRTLVVGRHGDPVAKPEHTAESYADALDAGVDYVEAEVVMSKDNQLVVRGSNELSRTTDVAARPEFADRQTTKSIEGSDFTGWFTEDFTLDELRTLRAVEPEPAQRPESASHDGEYAVIGFEDLVNQVQDKSEELDREIGIFVRPLRPAYFRSQDKPLEPAVVKALKLSGLVLDPERVTVESPDLRVLQRVEDLAGPNVLTAYVIGSGAKEALRDFEVLPDTIDAVAIEVGAFKGLDARGVCNLGVRARENDLALLVFPVSYENALLGTTFRNRSDRSPGATGNLLGQLSALAALPTDVIMAESPTEVIAAQAEVPEGQEALCE